MTNNEFRGPRNGHRYQFIGYMRVSNDLSKDNYTFETQEQRIREKLDRTFGVDTYDLHLRQDNGQSGDYGAQATALQKRTRKTLSNIQADLQSGAYDGLVVYRLNRLFRNLRHMLVWLEDIVRAQDIIFLSATEDIDANTTAGRNMLTMTAMMDASYREDGAARVRDAHATRVQQGYTVGPPPYGWRRTPADKSGNGGRPGIEPVPELAANVVLMKDLYLSGSNCNKVAGIFNDRGIPSSEGAKWTGGSVMDALKNPIHAGYVTMPGKNSTDLIQGRHYEQRLYDRDVWEQICSRAEHNKKKCPTNTNRSNLPHLMLGVAHCARCEGRLYIYTGASAYRAYRCKSGVSQGQPTCREVTARADWLEDAVVRELSRLAMEPTVRELLLSESGKMAEAEEAKLEAELKDLRSNLKGVEDRMERALDALTRGLIEESRFIIKNQELQSERAQLSERLHEKELVVANKQRREMWVEQVRQAVLDFPLCWGHLSIDERRGLLQSLVEKLTVDREGRDALIVLKVHMLEEREIRVSFDSMRQMKLKPVGAAALTPRQLVFLHYAGQGRTTVEIARLMGTTKNCVYTFALQVRKNMGIRDLKSAYAMARPRIEALLPSLPLGPTGNCTVHNGEVKSLPPALLEVLPLLARGASYTEVARLTGLTHSAVCNRRKRILDYFEVTTIFNAGEKARALGLI